MNSFLKNRSEVDIATKYLQENGYVESGLSCKNWEVACVLPFIEEGPLLDMGSNGGVIIENAVIKKIPETIFGIDLSYPEGIKSNNPQVVLTKGDLTNNPFPLKFFKTVTCLSVIEHQVNFWGFAYECARLLKKNGRLFFSFDYWDPKPDTSKTKLYSLDWNILDKKDVNYLIESLQGFGFRLTSEVDWTTQDAVINDKFCSPVQGVSYTIGLFSFIKQ